MTEAYGLTGRQREALLVLQELAASGRPPSLAELQDELEFGSRSGVHLVLCRLRDRGWIDWLPGRARSIRVLRTLPPPDEPVFVGFFEPPAELPPCSSQGQAL